MADVQGAQRKMTEDPDDDKHPFDEVTADLLRLARQLEAERARVLGEPLPEPVDKENDDLELEFENPEVKEMETLSKDEAAERLRKLPHEEIRGILRLQAENQELLKRIAETQNELDRLRAEQGATQNRLGEIGVQLPKNQPPPAVQIDEVPDPTLLKQVQYKVRILKALRKRWWKERQDPSTTVRRALATMGLPEAPDQEDVPPMRIQASLYERIHESMSLP
mmetsp:Transcript_31957/g.68043  ORF Transcript_31957/g.68043 Transcript_31957/m.68043 type:complete len:223 (+) Transcript_31957:1449-2117(+)